MSDNFPKYGATLLNSVGLSRFEVTFDGDGCDINYFATQAEALNDATNAIESMRDCDGWPEEIQSICVGYITHESRKVNEVTPDMLDEERCHDGKHYPGNFDYYCNYEMRPTEKECS